MNSDEKNEKNQAAYRRLRETINAKYPEGRFVAIADGNIVADAATFEEIDRQLNEMGIPNPEGLVIHVGEDYPDDGIILL